MQLPIRRRSLLGIMLVCIGLVPMQRARANSAAALGSSGQPGLRQSVLGKLSSQRRKAPRSIPKDSRASRKGLQTFASLDQGGDGLDSYRLSDLSGSEFGEGIASGETAKHILVAEEDKGTWIEGRFYLPLNLPLDTELDLVAVKDESAIRYLPAAGRAALGPGGSFRIRVPSGDKQGWLKLAGGNLVFRSLPRYTIEDGVATLWGDFAPRVGGILRVHVKDGGGHVIPGAHLRHLVQVKPYERQMMDTPDSRPFGSRSNQDRFGPTTHFFGPLLSSAPGEIEVRCDGYVVGFHTVEPARIRSGETTDMDLVLRPETPIAVTVVNSMGVVLPDAHVLVCDNPNFSDVPWVDFPIFGKTRRFFGRGPGTHYVQVSGDGLQTQTVAFTVPVDTEGAFEVQVTAELQFGIQGRVVWPDGSPVARAKVWVRPFVERNFNNTPDPEAYTTFFAHLGQKAKRTRTDKDGRFQAIGFKEAVFFEVLVICPAQNPKITEGMTRSQVRALERRSELYSLRAPVPADGQPITVVAGEALQGLHGRVVDDRGIALSEFDLEAYPNSDAELLHRSLRLDHLSETEFGRSLSKRVQHADGQFELGKLQAGEWCLKLSAPGFVTTVQRDVKPGEQKHVIVMDRISTLRGKVAGLDGVVPEGVRVSVSQQPDLSVILEQGAEFQLPGLAPGEYEVVAHCAGFGSSKPQTVTLRAGEDSPILELRLCKLGSIQGRVGERLTGMGWPLIVLVGQDALPVELRPDGSFVVEGVNPGSHSLDLAIPSSGKRPEALQIGIQTTVRVKAGEVSQALLNAEPGSAVVSGRITDNGEPASFASLYFETLDRSQIFAAPIGEDGRYSALVPSATTFNVFLGFYSDGLGGDQHFWLHKDWDSPKVQGQRDWGIPFARMRVEFVDDAGAPFQWFENKPPHVVYYFPERITPAFMLTRATEPDGSIYNLLPGGHYMLGTGSRDALGRIVGVLGTKFTVPLDGSIGVVKAVVKTLKSQDPSLKESISADPGDGEEQE